MDPAACGPRLPTIFSTRKMLVATVYNGLISHNGTHTVFFLTVHLLCALNVNSSCADKDGTLPCGTQPSLRRSEH